MMAFPVYRERGKASGAFKKLVVVVVVIGVLLLVGGAASLVIMPLALGSQEWWYGAMHQLEHWEKGLALARWFVYLLLIGLWPRVIRIVGVAVNMQPAVAKVLAGNAYRWKIAGLFAFIELVVVERAVLSIVDWIIARMGTAGVYLLGALGLGMWFYIQGQMRRGLAEAEAEAGEGPDKRESEAGQ